MCDIEENFFIDLSDKITPPVDKKWIIMTLSVIDTGEASVDNRPNQDFSWWKRLKNKFL